MKFSYIIIPIVLVLVGYYIHMNLQIKQDMLEEKYGFIKKCFSDLKCINEVSLPNPPNLLDPNLIVVGDDLSEYGYYKIFEEYRSSANKINITDKFRSSEGLKSILLTHEQQNLFEPNVRPNKIIAIESKSGLYTMYLKFYFVNGETYIDVYKSEASNKIKGICSYFLKGYKQSDFFFD